MPKVLGKIFGRIERLYHFKITLQLRKVIHVQLTYAIGMLLELLRIARLKVIQTATCVRIDVFERRFFLDQVIQHFNQHHVLDNVSKITCME